MNNVEIGNTILGYLKEKGKTQVDLANALSTSKQVVNKIVKGKKAIRTVELTKIAEFLEVTVDNLLQEREKVEFDELEAVHLYGKIKNRETADFILNLVTNLAEMEEELEAHDLLK